MNYRALVASALPMLVTLDDIPFNPDEEDEIPEEIVSDGNESADGDTEEPKQDSLSYELEDVKEPQPGPSNISQLHNPNNNSKAEVANKRSRLSRARPATTECAGIRPTPPELPRRPKTAVERPMDAPTRLQIMNTLMDDEWRCSGSKLTSREPVCGNLARSLLRSPKEKLRCSSMEGELEIVENTMEEACRAVAAEIPRFPNADLWAKFKLDTGIDIDIDFNARPENADPSNVLERLERIEKETMERLNANPNEVIPDAYTRDPSRILSRGAMSDYEIWRDIENLDIAAAPENVEDLFRDIAPIRPRRRRVLE